MRKRTRIKNLDTKKVTYSEINKYLTDNMCVGFVVSFIDRDTAEYSYHILFRNNKKPPQTATVRVNLISNIVMSCAVDGNVFRSVKEFMDYCKWPIA